MAKFTRATQETICGLIRKGVAARHAAIASGICEDTFYEWQRKHPSFSESIKKARSECVATLIGRIQLDKSWQSCAWQLERMFPSDYHIRSAQMENQLQQIQKLEKRILELEAEGRANEQDEYSHPEDVRTTTAN